ncbi:MAG TPA: MFS transporter, partial [Stellaceae bacterium]|nr:MFS transporter [Stellaceae bacterium]
MHRPPYLIGFLNLGHTIDHLMMLIFPTVVLTMAPVFGWGYDDMLKLSLGGFIAFGAGSIPAGWLGDRWSRRGMMIVYFIGIGGAAVLAGCAQSPWQLAAALTLVGLFGAIYHPVGIAMLVKDEERVGRALGINGIWGNLGVAFAALSAGGLAEFVGWRAAFIVPGLIVTAMGIGFACMVPPIAARSRRATAARAALDHATIVRVFVVLLVATACGGVIFNATTIAMPKVFDERLSALTQSTFGIGALVCAIY